MENLKEWVNKYPEVWWDGYDASMRGDWASACPYTPMDEVKMNVWLSGHVTATEDRKG